jgi:hypothetical protein
MRIRLALLIGGVALLACGLAPRLRATSIVPMSVEELAAKSQTVVEGRALEQWSQWDTNEHLIYTYTRFAVTQRLKGASAETIVVRQMGGSAGGYTQIVSGVRHWQTGDEAVLFLRPSVANDGSMAVVGLMQGNFQMTRANGVVSVNNGVPAVSMIKEGSASTFTGARMTLSEIEQRVRRAVQ